MGEAVLLRRGISPGTERSGVACGLGVARACDAQVDEVRSVGGHDDVCRRDVAMDDACSVQGFGCLTDLSRQLNGRVLVQLTLCLHEAFE